MDGVAQDVTYEWEAFRADGALAQSGTAETIEAAKSAAEAAADPDGSAAIMEITRCGAEITDIRTWGTA